MGKEVIRYLAFQHRFEPFADPIRTVFIIAKSVRNVQQFYPIVRTIPNVVTKIVTVNAPESITIENTLKECIFIIQDCFESFDDLGPAAQPKRRQPACRHMGGQVSQRGQHTETWEGAGAANACSLK